MSRTRGPLTSLDRALRESSLMILVVTLALTACVTQEGRFQRAEERWRAELERVYPAGSRWEGVPGPSKFDRWGVADPAPDGFAERALRHCRLTPPAAAVACWYGWVPRAGWGSSAGAVGMYMDYVFVDEHERVVRAYRRFLD